MSNCPPEAWRAVVESAPEGIVICDATGAECPAVYVNAAFYEDACDEKATVAVRRVFFGTEKGDAEFLHAGFEASDALEEEFGFGDAVVEYVAFGVVEFVAFGAATEFAAEVEVLEAGGGEGLFERRLIEVGGVV